MWVGEFETEDQAARFGEVLKIYMVFHFMWLKNDRRIRIQQNCDKWSSHNSDIIIFEERYRYWWRKKGMSYV